jgi:hypothetical protein
VRKLKDFVVVSLLIFRRLSLRRKEKKRKETSPRIELGSQKTARGIFSYLSSQFGEA